MGGFKGSLASLTAPQLGALAIKAAVERAGCPLEAVQEVYMGAVLQVIKYKANKTNLMHNYST